MDLDGLDALPPPELGKLAGWKEKKLPFGGRRGDEVRLHILHALRLERLRSLVHIDHCFPVLDAGLQIFQTGHESVSVVGGEEPQIVGLAHHHAGEGRARGRREKRGQRLAVSLRRRQLVRRQRIGAPARIEEDSHLIAAPLRRMQVGIAALVLQSGGIEIVPLARAHPTSLGQNDGHRL